MGSLTLSNLVQLFTKHFRKARCAKFSHALRNFSRVCELAFVGCGKFLHPLRNDIWDFRKPYEIFAKCVKCSVFLVFPMLENF